MGWSEKYWDDVSAELEPSPTEQELMSDDETHGEPASCVPTGTPEKNCCETA